MDLPGEHTSHPFRVIFSKESFQNHLIYKILLGLLLVAVVVLMFPHPESIEYDYSVGTIWTDNDLIAPFSFPIFKDLHEYEKERQEAIRNVFPVFLRDDTVARQREEYAGLLLHDLRSAVNIRMKMKKREVQSDSIEFIQILRRIPFSVMDSEWDMMERQKDFLKDPKMLSGELEELYQAGVIDQNKIQVVHQQLALRRGHAEEIVPAGKVYDVEEASAAVVVQLQRLFARDNGESLCAKIGRAVIQPNILFDRSATQTAIEIAADNVPRTIGFVLENERIISKNEHITDEVKQKLDSFLKAKAERGSVMNESKHFVGIILQVVIILGLFTIYLFLFRKKIFAENSRLALIALLITMETLFAYVSVLWGVSEPAQYLIFVPAASMLLTIIFDSRVGFYGTVAISLLVAGIHGNDYTIALTSLVAGALGAYTVRDIGNRTQIFRSMIFIFIGYAVPMTAFSLEQFDGFKTIAMMVAFALANAIFSPVLTYGLLIFFEKVFHVTTDLTLAELSDFNHPLLQRLSEEAPGTFHHSQTIGTMAEAAAEATGANAILARVGGYYHDIGKILKAEYFVENQVGSHSKHNRLRPRMSALIIQSHVKEGMDLAREYGLPENVVAFIPQHHGTTRISFFYDKALKQAAKRPQKDTINEEDFLYPGPKPQTKETGIVMLADSVEASTRALTEITPQRLEAAIDNMIKHRFIEGQLDECELTLRDLTHIKEAFLKILLGIHHQRITYPEQQPAQQTADQPVIEPSEPVQPVVVPIIPVPENPPVNVALEIPVKEPESYNIPAVHDENVPQSPPADETGQQPQS